MASTRYTIGVTPAQQRRVSRAVHVSFVTIPAFPNAFPYNELLLDGKLIAKTRNWEWKHRGLTLLYTSTKVHVEVVRAHRIDARAFPRKVIVGVGNLVDVRPLTRREWDKLYKQFNNVKRGRSGGDGFGDVYPMRIGFFFEDLKRFEEPLRFDWPSGPVKPIGIPVARVAVALKAVGIREVSGVRL